MTDNVRSDRPPSTSVGPALPCEANYDVDPDERLSSAIVRGIAAVSGIEPARLDPPLYEVVEPEAIDRLFARRHDGTDRTGGTITLRYGGYAVLVDTETRRIRIRGPGEADSS